MHCIKECECQKYSPRILILTPVQIFDIITAYGKQSFHHNYYPIQIMMMLLEQCGQIVVACKIDQGMTGDREPPLHLSHKRRQRCSNTAHLGNDHLFPTVSVTCPNFGNHHYLDIPMGHFKIINYINSIIYYLFSNIIYPFTKIKSTDTMEPDLIAETPRSNDTVSWKIKSINIIKFTNSKIQIQEPSQKSFVKTFSTSSLVLDSGVSIP